MTRSLFALFMLAVFGFASSLGIHAVAILGFGPWPFWVLVVVAMPAMIVVGIARLVAIYLEPNEHPLTAHWVVISYARAPWIRPVYLSLIAYWLLNFVPPIVAPAARTDSAVFRVFSALALSLYWLAGAVFLSAVVRQQEVAGMDSRRRMRA